jgi:hypothetical protein
LPAHRCRCRFRGALDETNPLDLRITTVPELVKKRGDAWSGWLTKAQGVEDVLNRDTDAPGRARAEHHR